MKKIMLGMVLVLSILCVFMTVTVSAATSGTCGDNVTWTLDDEGTLTISGTGEMEDWSTSSNVPWYSSRESITSVVVENGVTSIGERAFYHCTETTFVKGENDIF